jgi:hypothetical protein
MLIRGFLAMNGCYTGTVALADTAAQTLIALAYVARNGYFQFQVDAPPANAVLCGFPGQMLSGGRIAAATASRGLVYEAALPTAPGRFVYLNSASSCMLTLRRTHPALSDAEASTLAKTQLFGPLVTQFLPGYSAGFLAYTAVVGDTDATPDSDRYVPMECTSWRRPASWRQAASNA